MLSPWDILGWMVVAAASLVILCVLAASCVCVWRVFRVRAARLRLHLKTRDTQPCAGQRWLSAKGEQYRSISRVYEDGSVTWWGAREYGVCDSHNSWKKRVRKERLYLKVEPKKEESR